MKCFEFFSDLTMLIEIQTGLYNEKVVSPAPLQKKLPDVKAGLNIAHRELMYAVRREDCTVKTASEWLRLTPQYTSRLAENLFQKGFIEKYKSERNKTQVFLHLTESGRELLNECRRIWSNYIKTRVCKILDKTLRQIFLECLEFINCILSRLLSDNSYEESDKYEKNAMVNAEYYERLHRAFAQAPGLFNRLNYGLQSIETKKGYSFTENNCINILFDKGPLSMSALASNSLLPLETVSRVATKLVDTGLAERFQKPSDRRVYYVQITEVGRETILKERADFAAYLQKRFDGISDSDCEKLKDNIKFVNDTLRSF